MNESYVRSSEQMIRIISMNTKLRPIQALMPAFNTKLSLLCIAYSL